MYIYYMYVCMYLYDGNISKGIESQIIKHMDNSVKLEEAVHVEGGPWNEVMNRWRIERK
jgi:hypothetical protein